MSAAAQSAASLSSSSSFSSSSSSSSGPLTCDCWIAHKPGDRIVHDTVTLPPLADDEVEVKVLVSGVCATDVDALDKTAFAFKYPMIAGHEGVGIITKRGPRVPESVRIGQRVGLGCYRNRCYNCSLCFSGHGNLCAKNELLFAQGREGAFSTVVRIRHEFAIPIPDALETVKAAPLLCAGVTVFAPFRHHGVKGGDRVGIVGIGGLGHLAIQFASKMGCEVTAISQTCNKEPLARSLGAQHFLVLSDADCLTAAQGSLDFILVTAGGDDGLNWSTLLSLLAPNGKIVLVGVLLKDIPISALSLLLGQKSIAGSAAGSTAIAVEMLHFAAVNGVRAMVQTFKMQEVNEVFQKVKNNELRFRAVVCHDDSFVGSENDKAEEKQKSK